MAKVFRTAFIRVGSSGEQEAFTAFLNQEHLHGNLIAITGSGDCMMCVIWIEHTPEPPPERTELREDQGYAPKLPVRKFSSH